MRSLTVRTQATSAVSGHLLCRLFLRGRRRRHQEPGRPGVIGGQLNLQRGGPGLQPGHLGEPVQATVRQIPQRISITQGIGAGRIGAAPRRRR